ncbi:MAG: shikimate dehydrogenase [Microbacteriaceae bacterium]|nr:shikimate dehydrogenase [Microbacteriaceae bacterium]
MNPQTRLAVLGSPIAHSRSPLLHAAAYRQLGLDWTYEAVEATGDLLPGFLASRDDSWRGLSLTMPLKRDVMPLLDSVDATARLTRSANTVLIDRSAVAPVLRGFNTDVYGVTEAFREAGVGRLGTVAVLGGGATAASVLVAVQELGAHRVSFGLRDPSKAAELERLAAELGVEADVYRLADGLPPDARPDAVVSTIPGHGVVSLELDEAVRRAAVLLDVAYDPWPSALASEWMAVGGRVISGLDMLVHQAIGQIRVFTSGSPDAVLPREPEVLSAMRASISPPAASS